MALVKCYRTSTRALASTHSILRLITSITSMKLNTNFVGSGQDFLAVYTNYLYDYQEQTTNCPDTQLAEPQTLNYLQEAVSNDTELNHLRHREMLHLSDGKDAMELTRYIEALGDLPVLADQSTPTSSTPCKH
jgi:hypothetical protein